MLYSPEFFDRTKCSRRSKRSCVVLIDLIISLYEKGERLGLLSLEEELDSIDNPLLKKGLQFVIDGVDPQIVEEVIYTYMMSARFRGIDLLNAAVILDGILGIQSGYSPNMLREKLSAFLGKDIDLMEKDAGELIWDEAVTGYTGADIFSAQNADYMENAPEVNVVVNGFEFENIAGMHDIFVQKIMREIDSHDLAMALKGSSALLKGKIFSNMSGRGAKLLMDDIDFLGPVRKNDVIFCQEKILNIAFRLAGTGEIIIPDGSELIE